MTNGTIRDIVSAKSGETWFTEYPELGKLDVLLTEVGYRLLEENSQENRRIYFRDKHPSFFPGEIKENLDSAVLLYHNGDSVDFLAMTEQGSEACIDEIRNNAIILNLLFLQKKPFISGKVKSGPVIALGAAYGVIVLNGLPNLAGFSPPTAVKITSYILGAGIGSVLFGFSIGVFNEQISEHRVKKALEYTENAEDYLYGLDALGEIKGDIAYGRLVDMGVAFDEITVRELIRRPDWI